MTGTMGRGCCPPATRTNSGRSSGDCPSLNSGTVFSSLSKHIPIYSEYQRYSCTRGTAIALCCTAFQMFNVPVFWPILVVYFITLTFLTMRRQIQHMVKYKYVPFDLGRKSAK